MRIYQKPLDGADVALYTPKGTDLIIPPRSLAEKLGANTSKVCLVKSASIATDPGFKEIVSPQYSATEKFDIFADGVILVEHGSGVIFSTADCALLTLYERMQNRVVASHCGRGAITPDNKPGRPFSNIVTAAYEAAENSKPETDIRAVISGSICGHCFPHNTKEAQKLIRPFDKFGTHAFVDRETGSLDIVAIITKQLIGFGVEKENIWHDGICTKTDKRMVSFRENSTKQRNWTAVVLH